MHIKLERQWIQRWQINHHSDALTPHAHRIWCLWIIAHPIKSSHRCNKSCLCWLWIAWISWHGKTANRHAVKNQSYLSRHDHHGFDCHVHWQWHVSTTHVGHHDASIRLHARSNTGGTNPCTIKLRELGLYERASRNCNTLFYRLMEEWCLQS